jgi:P27 family predicted phage terminase small subunit
MPGRKRKSRLLRVVEGSPKRPAGRADSNDKPLTNVPAAPPWLQPKRRPAKADAQERRRHDAANASRRAARAWFDRWAEMIVERRTMTGDDVELLGLTAYAMAQYEQAVELLAAEGHTLVSDEGVVKRNPALVTITDAHKRVVSGLAEFGLTPAGRASLPDEKRERGPRLEDFQRSG